MMLRETTQALQGQNCGWGSCCNISIVSQSNDKVVAFVGDLSAVAVQELATSSARICIVGCGRHGAVKSAMAGKYTANRRYRVTFYIARFNYSVHLVPVAVDGGRGSLKGEIDLWLCEAVSVCAEF